MKLFVDFKDARSTSMNSTSISSINIPSVFLAISSLCSCFILWMAWKLKIVNHKSFNDSQFNLIPYSYLLREKKFSKTNWCQFLKQLMYTDILVVNKLNSCLKNAGLSSFLDHVHANLTNMSHHGQWLEKSWTDTIAQCNG